MKVRRRWLRWFEKQIQGEDRQKEQQVRLESELQLVKIVTIHKSKGLEYDLVLVAVYWLCLFI